MKFASERKNGRVAAGDLGRRPAARSVRCRTRGEHRAEMWRDHRENQRGWCLQDGETKCAEKMQAMYNLVLNSPLVELIFGARQRVDDEMYRRHFRFSMRLH
jgi:hypothetical protein